MELPRQKRLWGGAGWRAGRSLLALAVVLLCGLGCEGTKRGPAAPASTAVAPSPRKPAAEPSAQPAAQASPEATARASAEAAAQPGLESEATGEPFHANAQTPPNSPATVISPALPEKAAQLAEAGGERRPAAKPRDQPGAKSVSAKVAKAATMIGQLNPLDLVMPPVLLTEQHAATCLVKVGDQFPDLKLPDMSGEEKSLKELYGAKLTVIAFFTESNPYAIEELADFARTVGPQFEPEGAKIIAIDVKDPSQAAQATIERLKITFPILVDADGKAFQQVATAFFPRTFVVDATGKIVWFDIEYSRSTRRDMRRAILTTLHVGQ